MAFIETSETIVGVQIAQINARHVKWGQPVEITFKYLSLAHLSWQGRDGSATVSGGQTRVSGQAVTP